MRFRDLTTDITQVEQKLENVLLYVDFLPHELPLILLKDGSLLILFELGGLDYEGLSEEDKEHYSYFARMALEQLPDEGAGFMLSNILVRDKPEPIPLKHNPQAHPSFSSCRTGSKSSGMSDSLPVMATVFSVGCATSAHAGRSLAGACWFRRPNSSGSTATRFTLLPAGWRTDS